MLDGWDIVRRLVSGNKARIKDEDLNLELDLIYLTDQIIIMGYPAVGMEALYRNRREDAKRFLDHRHGKNYWVFNFCPLRENGYEDSVFEGRVSRYPFPDHHVPPLVYMPLVSREIHSWLSVSPQRIAVLHCKAGKGRSGTMACSYLLSQQYGSDHTLRRCQSAENIAKDRADATIATVSDDLQESKPENEPAPPHIRHHAHHEPLQTVLDLHTSRRMKAPSPGGGKMKPGVSIPSQRRWLHYWALSLSGNAPEDVWTPRSARSCVKIKEIIVRMKYDGGIGSNFRKKLIKAAAMMVDNQRSPSPYAKDGRVWVSLARYNDDLVHTLEELEERTRDTQTNMGISQSNVSSARSEFGPDGRWDKEKMIGCFARLGAEGVIMEKVDKDLMATCHQLQPLGDAGWNEVDKDMLESEEDDDTESKASTIMASMYSEASRTVPDEFIVDASRDVRVKLYMGLIFMGWFWFIPSFHLPKTPSINNSYKFSLTRQEIDFPVGVGSDLIDVEVAMEWVAGEEPSSGQEYSEPATGPSQQYRL